MLKTLKKQSGFSLVELMVVVAIIGILAAIAVPNFQKFTAKSKQSEAKANLSALYSSERAFQAEWQVYDTSFQAVGYQPVGNLRYQHGFATANHHNTMTGYSDPPTNQPSTFTYCAQGGNNPGANNCIVTIVPLNPGNVDGGNVTDGGATGPQFLAHAKGDIDGDSTWDVWTINQTKTLLNTSPDLEN